MRPRGCRSPRRRSPGQRRGSPGRTPSTAPRPWQIPPPSHQPRPVERVAIAQRRPGVADVVGAGEHPDAASISRFTGGIGTGPGPLVMIATPAPASASAVRPNSASSTMPSAKAWLTATRPQPHRRRPRGDLAQLEAAERAQIMKMDVDADAVPLRDGEDHIEMSFDVVVMPAGSSPPTSSTPRRSQRRAARRRRVGAGCRSAGTPRAGSRRGP